MIGLTYLTKQFIKQRRNDYGMLLEVFVSYLYHQIVKPGDIVIDAGVNAGMHFFPLISAVGDKGHVYGFDANPKLIEKVKKQAEAKKYKNYTLFANALFNTNKTMEFIVYPNRPGLSHLDRQGQVRNDVKKIDSHKLTVEAITLDSVVKDKISFIKMDLEGADFRALQGAKNILESSKPIFIFENSLNKDSKDFGYTKSEFQSFFRDLGYLLFDIHGIPLTEETLEERILSYELIGVHKNYLGLSELFIAISRFWQSSLHWRTIQSWGECAELGKKPPFLKNI